VKDDATFFRNALIYGNLDVSGANTEIRGNAKISRNTEISGNLVVYDNTYLKKYLYLDPSGNTFVHGTNHAFGFNKFTTPKLQLNNTLLKIISLQGVLKSINVPYRFMFYREYPDLNAFDNLTKMIDWNNIISDPYLYSYAHDIGEWDAPRTHPTPAAFNAYADIVAKYLKNQKLI
jgi:hypothetical protein